jgi:hypothetical protein
MIQRLAFLCLFSAFLLSGCATKNDSGVVLYKKPDLSKVAPGTPVSKVAGLKKPIKREVITKGELKGAEAWLYEWDAPNDEVNNKMFTSVVVKDGIITGFYEETPDKWRKDPGMLKQAKLQSAFEDLASSMAQAAQYQAAAGYLAGYGAQMANRASSAPMQAYNNAYASSYKPWENASSTANYGMVGGGPIPFGGGNQSASTTPANVYATRPNSGGLRDYSKFQPVGVVDEGKVYATRPNSGGLRDYSKSQPVGVVEDGKVYPVRPNSGGLRDYSKMQPVGVVEDQ